jgi:hypothetical protein
VSQCTGNFGSGMSTGYGRLDGTLTAIVRPQDSQCAYVNSTHLVLEVTANGSTQRLMLDTYSKISGDVSMLELDAPLVGDTYSAGWHQGSAIYIDYPATLSVSSGQFTSMAETDLINAIVCELSVGMPIAVYNIGFDATGGHDIHRHNGGDDGAIVIKPDTASPHYFLFHFSNQTF